MGKGLFQWFNKEESATPQNNRVLVIHKSRCPQNHPCPAIRTCPTGALKQKGYGAPTVDKSKCTNCGKCSRFCAYKALAME